MDMATYMGMGTRLAISRAMDRAMDRFMPMVVAVTMGVAMPMPAERAWTLHAAMR